MSIWRPLLYYVVAVLCGCSFVLLIYILGLWKPNHSPIKHHQKKQHLIDLHDLMVTDEIIRNMDQLNDDVTIVTGYFNLGTFQKGENPDNDFTPELYRRWIAIFNRITNPVVAYFDDKYYYSYFEEQRLNLLPLTKAIFIQREELWSFRIRNNISAIYSQPNYPIYHPNTVISDYSCVMHAKYELVLKTIRTNPFRSKYFAWLDLGLFRDINPQKEPQFHIHLPPNFNQSKVAYSAVGDFAKSGHISDEQIFLSNAVWVCGCFFIGRFDHLKQWTKEYLHYVHYFIEKNLMNTDQQVIYAIQKNHQPVTPIQPYKMKKSYNIWFSLGYLCKEQS